MPTSTELMTRPTQLYELRGSRLVAAGEPWLCANPGREKAETFIGFPAQADVRHRLSAASEEPASVAPVYVAGPNPCGWEQSRWVRACEEGADAHIILPGQNTADFTACSLWWTRSPSLHGLRVGFIGHFEARGALQAYELLKSACELLATNGCDIAIGPVNGSTWRSYRFMTWSNGEPPFAGEPLHPPSYPLFFTESGFSLLADYFSTATSCLQRTSSTRLDSAVTIRALSDYTRSNGLHRMFAVASESFRNNFLYQEIDQTTFISLYEPLLKFIDPDLVLIAEDTTGPVGFIFAFPQAEKEGSSRSIIVKTAARLPGRAHAGLGRILLEAIHRRAFEQGYRRAIHAFMHESNSSLKICQDYGTIIRRYSLFSRRL